MQAPDRCLQRVSGMETDGALWKTTGALGSTQPLNKAMTRGISPSAPPHSEPLPYSRCRPSAGCCPPAFGRRILLPDKTLHPKGSKISLISAPSKRSIACRLPRLAKPVNFKAGSDTLSFGELC